MNHCTKMNVEKIGYKNSGWIKLVKKQLWVVVVHRICTVYNSGWLRMQILVCRWRNFVG
jgi:hypothetical protein